MMGDEDRKMREIEFRGKKINYLSSEWVFGFYEEINGDSQIIDKFGNSFLILPKTLGQFTGIRDKKGNKVFDGDVVEMACGVQSKHKGVVKWSRDSYIVWNKQESGVRTMDGIITKVIGNVFDDSKLKAKYWKVWSGEDF